jgi:hypothetical protein
LDFDLDDVVTRAADRGLNIRPATAASATAALNAGGHVALVSRDRPMEVTLAFAELLADCAVIQNLCLGLLSLHGTASALVRVNDLITERFLGDLWLVLGYPSAHALSRALYEVRTEGHDRPWRLIVATSERVLNEAALTPAEKRLLARILV